MSVNAFPVGASAKTAQGGDLVLSRYKQNNVVVTTTDLPAGNYYLTVEGTGAVSIYSYTGTTTGALLTSATVTGATTISLTIPSGVSGIFVTGSYNGPMSFQRITSATPAVISATSFSEQPLAFNFGNTQIWKKIQNSSKFIRFELESSPNVYRALIADAATGQITRYNTALTGYRDSANNQLTAKPTAAIEANGAIIVSFMSEGNSPYIYRSANGGASWTNVHTMLASYLYNDVLEYNNGLFMLHSTGSASTAQTYYYTSTNGISWTKRDLPVSGNLLDVEYVSGNWVLFTGKGKNSGATPGTSTNYYTSSDGITWTTRDYVNPGWKAGAAVYSNTLFVIDENAVIKSSTDGITWSVYADLQSSYSSYGANATGEAFGASIPDNTEGTGGAWLPITQDSDTSTGRVVQCRPGQSAAIRSYTSLPQFGTSGESGQHPMNVNGRLALMSNSARILHFATTSSALNRISGVIGVLNSTETNNYFWSKRFSRWYFTTGTYVYYSDVNDPTKWNVSRQLIDNATATNLVETNNSVIFIHGNYVYRSTDGVTFITNAHAGLSTSMSATGSHIAFYNGRVVARTGEANVQVSNDNGLTWYKVTPTNMGASGPRNISSMSMGFLVEGGTATTGTAHWYSTDGVTWIQGTGTGTGNPMITVGSVNGITLFKQSNSTNAQVMPDSTTLNKISTTFPTTTDGLAVQLGDQIAYFLRSNTTGYFTTNNGFTWTFRNLSFQSTWRFAGGNDSQAVVFGFANTLAQDQEVIARVALTNTLTIG